MKLIIHDSIPVIDLHQFAQQHDCIIRQTAEDEFSMVPEAQLKDTMMHRHYTYTVAEMAKFMHIGSQTLFKKLRDDKIFNDENLPQQRYIDAGLFVVLTRSWLSPIGNKLYGKTKITRKGYHWLQKKYLKETSCPTTLST